MISTSLTARGTIDLVSVTLIIPPEGPDGIQGLLESAGRNFGGTGV